MNEWLSDCTSLTKLLCFFCRMLLQTDAAGALVFLWNRFKTRVWVTVRSFFLLYLLSLINTDKQFGHIFVNLPLCVLLATPQTKSTTTIKLCTDFFFFTKIMTCRVFSDVSDGQPAAATVLLWNNVVSIIPNTLCSVRFYGTFRQWKCYTAINIGSVI